MAGDARQESLFGTDDAPSEIADGDMTYIAGWLAPTDADRLYDTVLATSAWRQETIHMCGRDVPIPRITAWHADPGRAYAYSGITHEPAPWTPALAEAKARAGTAARTAFNSVLINQYRDGSDGVAWHSDDEPELGPAPVIASVNLGATRRFQVRRRDGTGERIDLDLEHGSLLVMHAGSQAVWEHRVPKTAKSVGVRLNLTFRTITHDNSRATERGPTRR